jgi:hypothetical protein
MKGLRYLTILFIFLLLAFFLPSYSWPQMSLGQYEDEAPFRTWNTFGITTAPSLGLGETRLTLASDCSAALSNPALLGLLPKVTITLNSSLSSASFFKYSLINTGVLYTPGNISLSLLGLDFAGASLRVKGWTLALSASLLETYDRPRTRAEAYDYSLEFDQGGEFKDINFSIARKIFGVLRAGIGLNFVYGDFKKEVIDNWTNPTITITDSLSHKFRGFYLNAGLVLDLHKIIAAAVFRTAFNKKAESSSLKEYYAPDGNTDIKIEASDRSEFSQPFVAGLGLSYQFSTDLRLAFDIIFYQWSKYHIIYFGEEDEIERSFKDIVKVGAGIEQLTHVKLFGRVVDVPLRAGLSYDPQPMKSPSSSYFYFSLGTGLHWGKFNLDAGAFIGKESGSGDSLSAKKFALSLSFKL